MSVIAGVFVEEVLDAADRAGVKISPLLEKAGIDPRDLGQLPPTKFAKIWLELSFAMEDEFFGLGQRPMGPGSFTLLCHAVKGAESFDVALRRALRFLKIVLGEPFGTLRVDRDHCTVTLIETEVRSAFAYRTFFLILHGLNCWLVGERIPIKRIHFPCPSPEISNDYGDFFGIPVVFGTEKARMSFDSKYLARPIARTEAELKVFLRSAPEPFLRGYRADTGLKAEILSRCLQGQCRDWPSTEEIAGQLGLSKSTLHRRLRAQGQSIGQIKEEHRRSRATYLLKTSNRPIAEIAEEVGYAEPSAFHRAFFRWFATTPGNMRQNSGRSGVRQS